MTNLRYLAARVINEVSDGHSLSDCLDKTLNSVKDPRDRAFIQAVCYGVCRYYTRLDVILSYLLQKPMKAKDSDVHALLLVGLFQLIEMRVPPHAAVAETVEAADKFKKSWARGLVNAVLREYLRTQTQINEKIQQDAEALYSHPEWWIKQIQQAWPQYWEKILEANNAHPPFAIRVNQQQLAREEYAEKLFAEEMIVQSIPQTQNGLILLTPVATENLPGFEKGTVSVQDGAAQLAAELLDLEPEQRVLDACSAPGGKLTHILEIEPDLTAIVALEKDATRIASIHENLKRLNFKANVVCADANDVEDWWDGERFDRILLDAPCSASGVIRRHPDIKLLREESDMAALAEEQLQLLEALWPLLKPNGLLVYATCSIFPAENTELVQQFVLNHEDAQEEPIQAEWGIQTAIGRQILPGMHNMDGFYYARLRKKDYN